MKRIALIVLLLLVCGCSDVQLRGKYPELLDKTLRLSQETADRAVAGTITEQEKTDALVEQAKTWKMFQDASKGEDGDN